MSVSQYKRGSVFSADDPGFPLPLETVQEVSAVAAVTAAGSRVADGTTQVSAVATVTANGLKLAANAAPVAAVATITALGEAEEQEAARVDPMGGKRKRRYKDPMPLTLKTWGAQPLLRGDAAVAAFDAAGGDDEEEEMLMLLLAA